MARNLKIFCRDCGSTAIIKKTIREHEDFSTLHCYCSNPECGHVWQASFEYVRTTQASRFVLNEFICTLIQKLPKAELEEVKKMLTNRLQAET